MGKKNLIKKALLMTNRLLLQTYFTVVFIYCWSVTVYGGNCPSWLQNLSSAEEPAVEIDQARRP